MQRSEPRAATATALLSIQVLRAFAVIGVVLMHVCLYLADRLQVPGVLPRFEVGAAGVDLFFIISGVVLVHASARLFGSTDGARVFLLRRVARIVPMYWLATSVILAYLLAQYGSIAAATNGASWDYVAASYLFIPAVRPAPLLTVGWTLNYEMFFYLVFGLLVMCSQRVAVLSVAALFVALAGIGLAFGPVAQPLGFYLNPIILEFALGALIALAYRAGVRLPLWLARTLIAVALAVLAWSWSHGHAFPPQAWARLAFWGVPAAMIVAGMVLSRAPIFATPFWRAMAFLGDASYSLYLFHTLTIPLPRILLGRFIDAASAPWLYAIAMLIAATVPAILIYLFVERPLTARLQRWIEPNRREPVPIIAPASSPTAPG